MRALIFIAILSVLLSNSALGQPSKTAPSPGSFKASGYTRIEIAEDRTIISGGSPEVKWTKDNATTTLKAAEIVIHAAKPQAGKKTAGSFDVEKIVLTGGNPQVMSEQDGFLLEAEKSITINIEKGAAGGFLQSATTVGRAHIRQVQIEDNSIVDAMGDNLEITEGGDKAVLTGNAVINSESAAYGGTISGEIATITGLRKKDALPAKPRIVMESPNQQSTLTVNEKPQPESDSGKNADKRR